MTDFPPRTARAFEEAMDLASRFGITEPCETKSHRGSYSAQIEGSTTLNDTEYTLTIFISVQETSRRIISLYSWLHDSFTCVISYYTETPDADIAEKIIRIAAADYTARIRKENAR